MVRAVDRKKNQTNSKKISDLLVILSPSGPLARFYLVWSARSVLSEEKEILYRTGELIQITKMHIDSSEEFLFFNFNEFVI